MSKLTTPELLQASTNGLQVATGLIYRDSVEDELILFNGYGGYRLGGLPEEQIAQMIAASVFRPSSAVTPTAVDGSISSVVIPELSGKNVVLAMLGGGQTFIIGDTLSETNKVATFNSTTNTLTFPVPLTTFVIAFYYGGAFVSNNGSEGEIFRVNSNQPQYFNGTWIPLVKLSDVDTRPNKSHTKNITISANSSTIQDNDFIGSDGIQLIIANGTLMQPPFTFNNTTGTISMDVTAGDQITIIYN